MTAVVSPPNERLQELTRDYSRYSRSAGGLSAVLGGSLCLASYLAGGLLPMSPALRFALVAMPVVWLATRQLMARHYYQRYGRVDELSTPRERTMRITMAASIAVISIIVVATFLLGGSPVGQASWDLRSAGYIAAVLCMPVVAWYGLRSPIDLVVGVFLLCQAALAFTAQSYALWSSAVVFPLAALLLIAAGIQEHRKFVAIEAEIRALVQARAPTT